MMQVSYGLIQLLQQCEPVIGDMREHDPPVFIIPISGDYFPFL
jgi:hypothetical protein